LSAIVVLAVALSSAHESTQLFPSAQLWSVPVSARPVASPVASGDRLFLALGSGISARRLADGSEIWQVPLTVEGSMAASEACLIVPSKEDLHALAPATGAVVWKVHTGRLTAPPVISGELLIIASGESVSALRIADGTRVWSADVGEVAQRPAWLGTRAYVPAKDGRLLALDLSSGASVWERDVGIEPSEPLVYGERVFVGSAGKRFCSLKVQTGETDWCFPVGAAVVGRAVADAKHVYYVALDNLLRAHNRQNGAMRWKKDLRYRPTAGPALVGRGVTAPGRTAKMQVFDAVTGAPSGELALAHDLAAVPVLIMSADGGEARLAALTGGLQNIWTLTLAGPPPLMPPSPGVVPLTQLPGSPIPVGAPSSPPG
jgi:outer membrane protein assembly factor BamB